MKRLTTGALALASLLLANGITFAQATPYLRQQSTNPYYQPPISPWLNMLRGGSPAANYYMGVVPEFRQRALNTQVGAQFQMMNQKLGTEMESSPEMEDLLPTLPSTGHATQFMNASPYYTLNPYLGQAGGGSSGIGRKPQRGQSRGR
jgi:hypothetical protein